MDATTTNDYHVDQQEISMTGSTGCTSSVRTGRGAKSALARQVTSKYMQAVVEPPTGQRHDIRGKEAYHLRAGGSMGYGPTSSTPATAMHAGRSLYLASSMRAPGILTTRTVGLRDANYSGNSPGAGHTSVTAGSMSAPMQLSSAFHAAAQERRREELAKFKQEKQAARSGLGVSIVASLGQTANAGGSASTGPRVPALALGILREGAQSAGDGNRSARSGGVYGGQGSARGTHVQSARAQVPPRPMAAPVGTTAVRAGTTLGNTAKVPPVPRIPAMPPPTMVEHQLKTAVNSPLPKDEVWEAAQVALPADGFDEGATGSGTVKPPSSKITKSPRAVAAGAPGASWAVTSQALPPTGVAGHSHQPSIPQRSPAPLSHRSMHGGSQATAPVTAGSMAPDAMGGRLVSNAEATTSDTGGRSFRDQVKMAKLQELQWRALKVKTEAAARARIEKGKRQLATLALLLTDMRAQCAANSAALATADVLKRTHHMVVTQLPLLHKWSSLEDTHGPATQEVLTALQNAMTSLPLVNGAALGMGGGDITQALPQLRRAIANGLGSLQSAEAAMETLLQGVNPRASGGGNAVEARTGQDQQGQGGVTAMATLLPQLHDALRVEVANLRSLLTNLNSLASQLDEAACLRTRTWTAASVCQVATNGSAPGGVWEDMVAGAGATTESTTAKLMLSRDVSTTDLSALMDQHIAMLGLGIGDM